MSKTQLPQLEKFCIYAGLLTGCWTECFLLCHKTDKDIKNDSLYKSVSRWRNSPLVQDYIRRLGYHKIKLNNGEILYSCFDTLEEPSEVYEPMLIDRG